MKKGLGFLTLLTILTSCGPSSNSASKDIVNIKRLSADLSPNSSQARIQSSSRVIHKHLKGDENNQAVLLYDYESVFYMTITLENPKAETIDAVQLTSYDPSAKVFVDGVFKPIHYDNGSRIVNWSQEDPYEKVIQINSSLNSNENFVEITDLKVNGKWQNEDLHNNTLYIKRVAKDGFSFQFIHNTFKEYVFKFNTDENVSKINVDGAVRREDGSYAAVKNGLISWSYIYNIDGTEYVKTGSKEVVLFKMVDTYNWYGDDGTHLSPDNTENILASFKHTLQKSQSNSSVYYIWVRIVEGTDVGIDYIVLSSGGKDYTLDRQIPGWHYPCYKIENFSDSYLKDEIVLKVGGMDHRYTKEDLLMPEGARIGFDDWFFDIAR